MSTLQVKVASVRKHRAPNGALRPSDECGTNDHSQNLPESTEHQKVH